VKTLLAAFALVASTAAFAETPPPAQPTAASVQAEPGAPWAWEMDLFAGYGQLAWPMPDRTNMTWSNGGPAFALTFAYRGEHFTHPFVELAYVPIYASGQYVGVFQPGNPPVAFASNSSYALGLAGGAGFDIDWFRLRVGMGLYDILVNTNVTGNAPHTVSQLGIGFLVSAAILVWQPDPFALGVEGRLVALDFPMGGIYQTMWSAGITGRWDFARSKSK
jgi:hypothetical protein